MSVSARFPLGPLSHRSIHLIEDTGILEVVVDHSATSDNPPTFLVQSDEEEYSASKMLRELDIRSIIGLAGYEDRRNSIRDAAVFVVHGHRDFPKFFLNFRLLQCAISEETELSFLFTYRI